MKKRKKQSKIPRSIYCDYCEYWKRLWWDSAEAIKRTGGDYSMYINPEGVKKEFEWMFNHPYEHKKEECQFADVCEEDCVQCKEMVSYCGYLNYIEYGQYPLGDLVKICGIKEDHYYETKRLERRKQRFKSALKRVERRANKKRKKNG